MVDIFSVQLSFLVFEAIFCFLSAFVYFLSKDPVRIRKSVVLSLDMACGFMLLSEYLFYVYMGSTEPMDVLIMAVVNAACYYLILLLMLFYGMFVCVRLFGRFDLKKDMPCRNRIVAFCALDIIGLILVTVSQFTGIYYYFDDSNIYQRGPLFFVSALIPAAGALLIGSVIIQYRKKGSYAQLFVLLSYMILPLIGETIQVLYYGNSLLNICIGLSVLLMFYENMVYKEKEIAKATRTEVRTGLANEHGYIEWLNSMKGNPKLKDYVVVFFDLRKFSDFNRKYGIENGNRILASFGNVMLGHIMDDEILGRQYGNQFVAIVRKEHLNNLLETLKGVDVPFTDIDSDKEIIVTLSARAGVYNIDRTDLDGEDILVFAGQALSAAKSKENDDVVWLTQDLIDEIAARKKLESDIDRGLKTGEFIPFYQPKVNIRTGKMCGAEALSRWHHNGEIVTPGKYIPIMEANETICLLDFCILKSVCEDIKQWIADGIDVPVISVNFSRRNLVDPELANKIDTIVVNAGVPKNLIEIEVTESSDEFSIGVLSNFVKSLHTLGYHVSIDDFGCASSSLMLLREIPFDTLKIDKGFVDHAKNRDITILTHIIKLAFDIDMSIVAEGVELKGQIDTLDSLGVKAIQGFYFDKPLPKEDMTQRLRNPEYSL